MLRNAAIFTGLVLILIVVASMRPATIAASPPINMPSYDVLVTNSAEKRTPTGTPGFYPTEVPVAVISYEKMVGNPDADTPFSKAETL